MDLACNTILLFLLFNRHPWPTSLFVCLFFLLCRVSLYFIFILIFSHLSFLLFWFFSLNQLVAETGLFALSSLQGLLDR